ncbi:hypothetical protein [Methyloferula stellata]|uniref:hypothetical protein n=1 Tax=Methyloferula stellata TaxID=876270 RepID=UPI00036FB591|nr:hypothetical protein [Methyloferula stellata]
MQLTIASAIARSGADPWKEAARISKLPKDVAIQVLTRLMPDQTGDSDQMANDARVMADRLFSLLPKRKYAPVVNTISLPRSLPRTKSTAALLVLAFCAAVLIAYLFAIALPSGHRASPGNPAPAERSTTSD